MSPTGNSWSRETAAVAAETTPQQGALPFSVAPNSGKKEYKDSCCAKRAAAVVAAVASGPQPNPWHVVNRFLRLAERRAAFSGCIPRAYQREARKCTLSRWPGLGGSISGQGFSVPVVCMRACSLWTPPRSQPNSRLKASFPGWRLLQICPTPRLTTL